MPSVETRAVPVVRQDGDHVLVSVPMIGFPAGFRLRPGERVVLSNDDPGPAVRPLVKATVVHISKSAISKRGAIEINGNTYTLQPATILNDLSPGKDSEEPREYVFWLVDPGTAEGPPQVIAARSR